MKYLRLRYRYRVALYGLIAGTSYPVHALQLGALVGREREIARKLAGDGALVLVESSAEDVPEILVTARVDASASKVKAQLLDVQRYVDWMPTHDSIHSLNHYRSNTWSYRWHWRVMAFSLQGYNTVSDYTQEATGQYIRPIRVEQRYASGQLGAGRFIWRVDPISSNRCWVTVFAKLDVREGDSFAKGLTQSARSFNRSTAIGIALYMIQGLREQLGVRLRRINSESLSFPMVEERTVRPLLDLGDVVWVGLSPAKVQDVWTIARTGSSHTKLMALLSDQQAFGTAMMRTTLAKTEMKGTGEVTLKWGLSIPLLGSSGTLKLKPVGENTNPVIEVNAIEGSMLGGVWRFSSWMLPWGEGCLVGWARFNAGDGFWLTRHLVERQPQWSSGLAVASEILSVRAVRAYLSD